MTISPIEAYVRERLRQSASPADIRQALIETGWDEASVDQAFRATSKTKPPLAALLAVIVLVALVPTIYLAKAVHTTLTRRSVAATTPTPTPSPTPAAQQSLISIPTYAKVHLNNAQKQGDEGSQINDQSLANPCAVYASPSPTPVPSPSGPTGSVSITINWPTLDYTPAHFTYPVACQVKGSIASLGTIDLEYPKGYFLELTGTPTDQILSAYAPASADQTCLSASGCTLVAQVTRTESVVGESYQKYHARVLSKVPSTYTVADNSEVSINALEPVLELTFQNDSTPADAGSPALLYALRMRGFDYSLATFPAANAWLPDDFTGIVQQMESDIAYQFFSATD